MSHRLKFDKPGPLDGRPRGFCIHLELIRELPTFRRRTRGISGQSIGRRTNRSDHTLARVGEDVRACCANYGAILNDQNGVVTAN